VFSMPRFFTMKNSGTSARKYGNIAPPTNR